MLLATLHQQYCKMRETHLLIHLAKEKGCSFLGVYIPVYGWG